MSQDLRRFTRRFGLALGPTLLLAGAAATDGWTSDRWGGKGNQTSFSVTLTQRNTATESAGGPYRLTAEARGDVEGDLIFSDGFESGDLSAWGQETEMPVGSVVFFDSESCPPGWTTLPGQSRFIVGLPAGGQAGGLLNAPLHDLFPPIHSHFIGDVFQLPGTTFHYHWWSELSAAAVWTSYHADNTDNTLVDWGNGIGNEGEGYYPLAAGLDSHFETGGDQLHSHSASFSETSLGEHDALPYIKLSACEKAVNR